MNPRLQCGLFVSAVASLVLIAGCPLFVPPEPTGDAVSGETIWTADNCLTCHGQVGCGGLGPDIRSVTLDKLKAELGAADTTHTGGARPGLSDQDLADLAAYLNSITDDDCATSAPAAPSKVANFALMSTHDPFANSYNDNCTSCHGDRARESALDGSRLAAHSVMPGLLGSGDERCLTCHSGGVDFVFQTTSRLRENMILQSGCASSSCHGASSAIPFYAVDND